MSVTRQLKTTESDTFCDQQFDFTRNFVSRAKTTSKVDFRIHQLDVLSSLEGSNLGEVFQVLLHFLGLCRLLPRRGVLTPPY